MLLLTVIILIILSIISYFLFDKDMLSPSFVVSTGMLFSAFCALYNEERWNLDFSGTTTIFIGSGVLAFIVGSILAIFLANVFNMNKFYFSHPISKIEPIAISKFKTFLVLLFQIIVAIYLYNQVKYATGGSNWIEVSNIFRNATGLAENLDDDTFKIPFLLKQSIDICFYLGLVYSYIVGNNLVVKSKQNLFDWMPILVATLIGFLQAYRSDMLRYWIAILVVCYVQKMRINGWHITDEIKIIVKRIAYSVIVIALIFLLVKELVGRDDDMDGFYYIAFYAGSPVAALDLFLKAELSPSTIWGKETFFALNRNFAVWLNMPELLYVFYKEFRRTPNGTIIGNVYTVLRPPYYDFGYMGMLLYMFIMGLFFTYFYYKIRTRDWKNSIDMGLLVYSYMAYTFFMYFYNLYNNFISVAMLKNIILLYLIRWILVKFKINLKVKT